MFVIKMIIQLAAADRPVLVRSLREISSPRPLPDPPDAPLLSLSCSECRRAPSAQRNETWDVRFKIRCSPKLAKLVN
jgi:hypothetical protein